MDNSAQQVCVSVIQTRVSSENKLEEKFRTKLEEKLSLGDYSSKTVTSVLASAVADSKKKSDWVVTIATLEACIAMSTWDRVVKSTEFVLRSRPNVPLFG